jgi:23S rRNA (adenine2503-C2)-methyltransferase
MIELLGKSKDELSALCSGLGEAAYRGAQLYHALYVERIFDIASMTTLSAALRERLAAQARVTLPIVRQRYLSQDGSVRYLLALPGSEPSETSRNDSTATGAEGAKNAELRKQAVRPASVEAVFMPSEGRQTICISTQAGCAVDCQFCLTAQLGLIRNLTPGEIVAQVLLPLEEHKAVLTPNTNIVLMGQGEPLLNFDSVTAALRILLDAKGVAISPKHATLSTSGIVPGIERLAKEDVRPGLAISLNASNDEQRNLLMPINRKYPLAALMKACREYPLRSWEYLMFEYVMLGGVNDSLADARRIVKLLAPLQAAKVNLIPWNPGGALPYHESPPEVIETFQKLLIERGIPTFVRHSRGRDVMAACGQLALNETNAAPLAVLP